MELLNILRVCNEMIKINQLETEQVQEIQRQKFRKLLHFAAEHSEFYGNLYQGIDLEKYSIEDLPIITKQDMMRNFNHVVTDKKITLQEVKTWIEKEHKPGKLYLRKYLPIVTSGSTGEKAIVVYDRTALSYIQAALFSRYPYQRTPTSFERWKILLHYLLGAKARLGVIVAIGGSVHVASTYAPKLHGLLVHKAEFSIMDSVEKTVKDLNAFKPDQLITYPSLIDVLAQEQIEGRLDISFDQPMSFLVACAEPLYERTKKLAKQAWNVDILDTYGATECFVMARSCNKFDRMHIMSDLCILEIVDKEFNPVRPGQRGSKVLLTNLFNYVQPFIRYELTDIAEISDQPCSCGLPFPTLKAVEGRTDDILYFENQEGAYMSVHPFVLITSLGHLSGLRQFQIVQTKRNEIMCRFVPENVSVHPEINIHLALEKVFKKTCPNASINIKTQQMDSISRSEESKKYKSILSRVGPPQALKDEPLRRRATGFSRA